MQRVLKFLTFALLPVAGLLFLCSTNAQPPAFLPLTISATRTNDSVMLSWHLRPGIWEIVEQRPAYTGDWKSVATNLYQTNADMVSITLPLPAQTSLYKLKRVFIRPNVALPEMPPLPPTPAKVSAPPTKLRRDPNGPGNYDPRPDLPGGRGL